MSGKRKKRAISPVTVDQPSLTSKTKQEKINLDFSGKEKEAQHKVKIYLTYPTQIKKKNRNKNLT